MDLAQYWQERRWVALLELIDQLPEASRLNEAIQNDPERAKIMAEFRMSQDSSDDKGEVWSPRIAEFDLHALLTRDLIQAVVSLRTVLIAVNSKKSPKDPPPYPTPITEVDRAMKRLTDQWAADMTAIFTPNRG